MDREMQKALEADGEKLRAMTGEDHGPHFVSCDHPEGDVSFKAHDDWHGTARAYCSACGSEWEVTVAKETPPSAKCVLCDGGGTVCDWIGLEMEPAEVECSWCHGTGKQ